MVILQTHRLIESARAYAIEKHGDQKRKYDDVPYIVHLERVVRILDDHGFKEPEMLAAAFLHDTVEDTDATIQELTERFGEDVAQLVYWLTDTEAGNRKSRAMQSAWRLSRAPFDAKLIKLADIIDNGTTIREHDAKFAPVFLDEKRQILRMMADVEKSRLMQLPLFLKAVAVTDFALYP